MKSPIAAALFALLAMWPAGASLAQTPAPEPTPADPHVYSDPAMNFRAPADAYLVGRRMIPLDKLTSDLEPVAVWAMRPGKEDMRTISIVMEAFDGPPDQWEGQFESQMHSTGDGVLIRKKMAMSLLNGMPANFVEITSGNGFTARKEFAVVWADGQRGVALSLVGRLGDIGADEALAALKNATATRYPFGRP
jgi:hypothetical protein